MEYPRLSSAEQQQDQLLQLHGEQYWVDKVSKAKTAIGIMVACTAVAIILNIASRTMEQPALPIVALLVNGIGVIYFTITFSVLLVWNGWKPWAHWTAGILMALLGCGGIIIWLIMNNEVKKVDKAVQAAVARSHGYQRTPGTT